MFHFDNSFNYPVRTLQDDPNVYMFPEKLIENDCPFVQENLKDIQYGAIPVSCTASNPSLPFDSLRIEQQSKLYQSKPNKTDIKRRHMVSKAERRAEHNAIERARRECLNSKFQKLANVLPNLRTHRRPSKGQIVEKALDWVKQNITMENRYQYQIMQLQNENKRLINQITVTQENEINSHYVDPSPLYIPVNYPSTQYHSLQQQVPMPFDNSSAISVSPISSSGSNFAIENNTDNYSSIANSKINDATVEHDLSLSSVTDEDDSDNKSADDNLKELDDPNNYFFEYQITEVPIQNKSDYNQYSYDINRSGINHKIDSYPMSFIE